ncbi:MAG: ribokinase [Candidatus Aminicenantes bacterium]|jgi:ribokinase|nr:ribokinase [Candidatus Aminicenantes bacterium]
MKRVLVVGSSNTDMVIRVPHIPRPGETVLGTDLTMAGGGKGANQAVAAARAGGRVTLVARVGDDVFGGQAVAAFAADGLETRFVLRTPGISSGVALINVDDRGENSISVASGANARLSVEDVKSAAAAFEEADIVLLQLESPLETVAAVVRAAGERGVPVVLNPAPARPLDSDLLSGVSVLTPNETEAELLSGIPVRDEGGVREAAARLRRRGPRAVVITLGDRGVYASSPDLEGFFPAFRVEAVDTTAAGDVFNGALAVALAEKRPLPEALRFAQAAAAISVTRPGAQPSAPTRAEIEAF